MDVCGFSNEGYGTLHHNLPSIITSYLKYMGYTHVLLLNLNTSASDNSLGNLATAFIDTFHSNGIKVILHITPRDVTDKKLYVYTLVDKIERLEADGVFIDVPYIEYCDKPLIREISDAIHNISNNTAVIVDKRIAAEYNGSRFDYTIDSAPFIGAVDFVSLDPYFRRHTQDLFEKCLSNEKNTRVIPLSCFDSRAEFKSIFESAYGSYEDKLNQKRAIDLLIMSLHGKKLTLMGNEFSGCIRENNKPMVNWNLLDVESHNDMRSFVRSLNHFYLATPVMHSDDTELSLIPLSENEKGKNIILLKRKSQCNEILTVVNLSGIEQSIDIISKVAVDCIFATQYHVNSASIHHHDQGDTYTITLPAFCGAVYRLK